MLMAELNNRHVLIRIYTRTVASLFILLYCTCSFLFPSLHNAVVLLLLVTSLFTVFNTYQDKTAVGWTFYSFSCLSMASMLSVWALLLIPVYWGMMILLLYSMSWRTLQASIIGLLTPYFFLCGYFIVQKDVDFTPLLTHFSELQEIGSPSHAVWQSLPLKIVIVFDIVLFLTGAIHYLRSSYLDKIRTRQLFYALIYLHAVAMVLLFLLPQLYPIMLSLMIVTVSPLLAHFVTLTSTKVTNIAFVAILAGVVIITAFNSWMATPLRF